MVVLNKITNTQMNNPNLIESLLINARRKLIGFFFIFFILNTSDIATLIIYPIAPFLEEFYRQEQMHEPRCLQCTVRLKLSLSFSASFSNWYRYVCGMGEKEGVDALLDVGED
jgi:hypothetical protein